MYAIVSIAGQQFKVEKDQKLFVHRLADKEGETVRFDDVLLIDNDKNILIGEPVIEGAMITGKILSHPKADKIQVFKKKRRKGYKVLNGHRQSLTHIQIQEIVEKGAKKAASPKAATKAETKPEVKAETKTETGEKKAPAKKPAAVKKTTASKSAVSAKPAAKKAPAKKAPAKKAEGTAAKSTSTAKPAVKKSTGTTAKAAPKKPAADKKDKK
jgi:large subunit ribosomal protein L21